MPPKGTCLVCGDELDPRTGLCPRCSSERAAKEQLKGPTLVGQTRILTRLHGPTVAWAVWNGLPYPSRLAWHQRLGGVQSADIEEYLRQSASPPSLWLAAQNQQLPEKLRTIARERLDALGLTSQQIRELRRYFWRLMQMSRRRLLKHLGSPSRTSRWVDRLDLLAEVTALREVQAAVRAERSLARAFRAMFRTSFPWTVVTIISICVAVFYFWQELPNDERFTRAKTYGVDGHLEFTWTSLRTWLTYGFLHGGVQHILYNMLSLLLVGHILERILGPVRFLAVYVACTVGGALASIAYKNVTGHEELFTIGASGSVAGIAGMSLFLGLWFASRYGRIPMRYTTGTLLGGAFLVLNTLINATELFMDDSSLVDHWCHLGGLIVGIVAGLICKNELGRTADARFGWRGGPTLAD